MVSPVTKNGGSATDVGVTVEREDGAHVAVAMDLNLDVPESAYALPQRFRKSQIECGQ